MIYSKLYSDTRGRIRVEVRLVVLSYDMTDQGGNKFRWDTTVWHRAPRKKIEIINNDIATPAEIWAAKKELWYIIEPK